MREPSFYKKQDGSVFYKMSSRAHPSLTEFHSLLYSRPDAECSKHVLKKRITPEILSMVDDLALAIWWADDGSFKRWETVGGTRVSVTLLVGAMTDLEYDLIQGWLEGFGYSVRCKQDPWKGNCVEFFLGVDDSELFASRVSGYLPDCLETKSLLLKG